MNTRNHNSSLTDLDMDLDTDLNMDSNDNLNLLDLEDLDAFVDSTIKNDENLNSVGTTNLTFHDLAEDEDGFEAIFETKEEKRRKEVKQEKKQKAKRKKANAEKSIHREDDLIFFDEFSQNTIDSIDHEMDLEDLVSLELSPDIPEGIYKPDEEAPSKEFFSLSWFTIFYLAIVGFCLFVAYHYYQEFKESIVKYENSQPELYVEEILESFRDQEVAGKIIEFPEITYSRFDDTKKLTTDYLEFLSTADLTYNRAASFSVTAPVFDFYAKDQLLGTIYLSSSPSDLYLDQFQTYRYFCTSVMAYVNVEPHSYTLRVPSSYHVYINKMELDSRYYTGQTETIDEFLSFYDITDAPFYTYYQLDDLIFEPDVVITTPSGHEVTYLTTGNLISAVAAFDQSDFPPSLLQSTDIISFMEHWSNYLSGDLNGNHGGFELIDPYLLKETPFYSEAYNLFSDEAIPIYEKHTLPEFEYSARSVSQYTLFTDDFFACTVSLEKNIILEDGTTKTYLETYRCYYVKEYGSYEDGNLNTTSFSWKIAKIEKLS